MIWWWINFKNFFGISYLVLFIFTQVKTLIQKYENESSQFGGGFWCKNPNIFQTVRDCALSRAFLYFGISFPFITYIVVYDLDFVLKAKSLITAFSHFCVILQEGKKSNGTKLLRVLDSNRSCSTKRTNWKCFGKMLGYGWSALSGPGSSLQSVWCIVWGVMQWIFA